MITRNDAALDAILQRRSVSRFVEDVLPTAEELELLLRAAATVPDHGELRPYRFVVSQGEGRARFGDALAAAGLEKNPDLPAGIQDKLRHKAFAAPTQILLIASPREGMKIPEWEQVVTASCTGYAITLAAYALGLGAIWKSAPILEGAQLRSALDLRGGERLLGWVNVGRPVDPESATRNATPIDGITRVLSARGLESYRG
jgi:nitroreductase